MSYRQKLIRQILEEFSPHFYSSGYVEGGPTHSMKPVRLYAYPSAVSVGGFVINEIIGITSEGVITDSHGGAMVTTYWSGIPVEDLFKISKLKPEAKV